jgi:hypothetical protein
MTVSNSLINMSRKNLFTIPGTWEFNAPKTSYSSYRSIPFGKLSRHGCLGVNGDCVFWPA